MRKPSPLGINSLHLFTGPHSVRTYKPVAAIYSRGIRAFSLLYLQNRYSSVLLLSGIIQLQTSSSLKKWWKTLVIAEHLMLLSTRVVVIAVPRWTRNDKTWQTTFVICQEKWVEKFFHPFLTYLPVAMIVQNSPLTVNDVVFCKEMVKQTEDDPWRRR